MGTRAVYQRQGYAQLTQVAILRRGPFQATCNLHFFLLLDIAKRKKNLENIIESNYMHF